MKIKKEYKGKTIVTRTSLGNITVICDNIDVTRYQYYVTIGLGYIFEDENKTTTAPEKCINYEGIDQTIQDAKPKAKRTKRRVSSEMHGGPGEQK